MNTYLRTRIEKYITRYAPSRKRLFEYIWKFHLSSLDGIEYDEWLMLRMWIKSYLALGKDRRYVEMKLLIKWFVKSDIVCALTEFDEVFSDWNNFEGVLSQKIQSMVRLWKSKQRILFDLWAKYPHFKNEIQALIHDGEDDAWNLQKEFQKIQWRYNMNDKNDKNRCIASLQRKWFRYSDIVSLFSD